MFCEYTNLHVGSLLWLLCATTVKAGMPIWRNLIPSVKFTRVAWRLEKVVTVTSNALTPLSNLLAWRVAIFTISLGNLRRLVQEMIGTGKYYRRMSHNGFPQQFSSTSTGNLTSRHNNNTLIPRSNHFQVLRA